MIKRHSGPVGSRAGSTADDRPVSLSRAITGRPGDVDRIPVSTPGGTGNRTGVGSAGGPRECRESTSAERHTIRKAGNGQHPIAAIERPHAG